MEIAVLAVLCFFPVKPRDCSFDAGFKNRSASLRIHFEHNRVELIFPLDQR